MPRGACGVRGHHGVEAAKAHGCAVGDHALRGILKEVLALYTYNDLLVACALHAKGSDDAHLMREELLAGEHPPPNAFCGYIHSTRSKGVKGCHMCAATRQAGAAHMTIIIPVGKKVTTPRVSNVEQQNSIRLTVIFAAQKL